MLNNAKLIACGKIRIFPKPSVSYLRCGVVGLIAQELDLLLLDVERYRSRSILRGRITPPIRYPQARVGRFYSSPAAHLKF